MTAGRWHLLFLLAGLLTTGCLSPPTRIEVSINGTQAPTAADTASPTPDSPRRLSLQGIINETIGFHVSFRPHGAPLLQPTVEVVPVKGPDESANPLDIQLFRMQSVAVHRFPGWHIRSFPLSQRVVDPLDVLVPLSAPVGGMPKTLSDGDVLDVWVDLTIPKGAAASVHSLCIELRGGTHRVASIDVDLTVHPLVLPDDPPPTFLAEVDVEALLTHSLAIRQDRETEDKLIETTMRLLRSHRLNPFLNGPTPRVDMDSRGEPKLHWDDYDARVEPFLDGTAFPDRIPLRPWPLPFEGLVTRPDLSSAAGVRPSDAFVNGYVRACIDHFRKRGWLDRSYADLEPDTDNDARSLQDALRLGRTVQSIEPSVRRVTRGFPQDAEPIGWIGYRPSELNRIVDTWMPPAQFFDAEMMRKQRSLGRRTWIRADRPPSSGTTSIHGSPTDARVLSWQATALGAEVMSLGVSNPWPKTAATNPEDCMDHDDHALLYPGRAFGIDEPVASVRLKHLRQSQQDAAYLKLLEEQGNEATAATLRAGLVHHAGADAYRTHFADGREKGWNDDQRAFDLAKTIALETLLNDPSNRAGQSSVPGSSPAWRQFMALTNTVRLRMDGARVRWVGAPPNVQAEVELAASMSNLQSNPQVGSFRIMDPPPGWVVEESSLVDVPPRSDHRLTLRAKTSNLVADRSGILNLTAAFIAEDGSTIPAGARVSWVRTVRRTQAIRIDGDLSDWPLGTDNVAADFRAFADSTLQTPKSATTVFFARDDQFLYVAALSTLSETARGPTKTSRRKGIAYDDLVPIDDEDLVELLIDPLNGGTRSPSDILHIVVKRTGTDVVEKGIATTPPCGMRIPWPVDLQLATAETAQGWTVELRIPLSAITDNLDAASVWGVNITRWDAAHQEFSNWSAASNPYDPLSLGNLYLP